MTCGSWKSAWRGKGSFHATQSSLPCIQPNLGDDFDGGGSILFRINLGGKRGRMAQVDPG
jgi:hypothetical protein